MAESEHDDRAVTSDNATMLELLESRRSMQTLLRNLPGMAYRCRSESDWRMAFVSEGARDLTGYDPEDIIDSRRISYDEIIHPDDRESAWQAAQAAMARHEPFYVNYRIIHADGKVRWVADKGVGVWGEDGALQFLEGFVADVTPQRLAEIALRERDDLIHMAGRFAHFGGWSVDLACQRVTWSDEVAAIHDMPAGYSPLVEEGINFYAPEWRNRITEVFTACAQHGTPYDEEMEILTRTGRRVWVRTSGFPVRDDDGRLVRVEGFFQDITTKKEIELLRRHMEERLANAHKMESLGRMAGAVAHHYNNHLQAVMGNLELALQEVDPGSDVFTMLKDAFDSARQSAEVSRLMLAYLGQNYGESERVNLSELLRGWIPTFESLLPHGIGLVCDFPTSELMVQVMVAQLEQALRALIVNAGEATRPGSSGTVTLRLREEFPVFESDRLAFPAGWTPLHAAYVCISVEDQGCGIADENKAKLFDPFFSTKFVGRGLGLPVVLGFVRADKGGVLVDSSPGKGARFSMYLSAG